MKLRHAIVIFSAALALGAVVTERVEIQIIPTAPHQHGVTSVVTARDPELTNNVAGNFIVDSPWNSAVYATCNANGRGCIKANHKLDPTDTTFAANAAVMSLTMEGEGNLARALFIRPGPGTAGNYMAIRTAPDRPIQRDVFLAHKSDRIGIGVPTNKEPAGRLEVVQGVAGEAQIPALVLRASPGATTAVLRLINGACTFDLMPDATWVKSCTSQ